MCIIMQVISLAEEVAFRFQKHLHFEHRNKVLRLRTVNQALLALDAKLSPAGTVNE